MSQDERSQVCPECGYDPCECEEEEDDSSDFDDDEMGIDPEREDEDG